MKFPKSIQNLIEMFSILPTVGPKTAERFVFYLLNKKQEELTQLADAIIKLRSGTIVCQKCFCLSEKDPCEICSDFKRDRQLICVVADTRDMISVESTKQFSGYYHVLNGELDPIEGIKPEQLTINELLIKIKNNGIREIILALNPTIEGETTALYLLKLLKSKSIGNIKITRIARGLPMGANLEYADEMTLGNALKYRNEL